MEAGSRLAVSPIAPASSRSKTDLYWPSTMEDALLFRLLTPGRFPGVGHLFSKPSTPSFWLLPQREATHAPSLLVVQVGRKSRCKQAANSRREQVIEHCHSTMKRHPDGFEGGRLALDAGIRGALVVVRRSTFFRRGAVQRARTSIGLIFRCAYH